ncbi:MAG: dicarboxylate/amino acid:cation symporter [Bacteroidales bacterium]|nr:dicarboxylate/amino acid:cation symporter [Bacteroidales bacterium]MBR6865507.1 dicarboxylate/amino acid:cation symporter [Bacteroidales bacterium]
MKKPNKQLFWWLGALVAGTVLGLLKVEWIDTICNFVATVYTRLFQFLAVPTVALAITTTLISFGRQRSTRKVFGHTITYTLLTTLAAALVGLGMYLLIAPQNIPADVIGTATAAQEGSMTFRDHIISVIPNNLLQPFLSGNVLSILLIAVAVGLALAYMKESDRKTVLVHGIEGLQELFFILIKALIWTLPLGITAFAAQLSAQLSGGIILGSLGKYTAVILLGNVIQFFLVLPVFLLIRGINPLKVFKAMSPAVVMALFTKSSAATLPVTLSSAENRLGADPKVARFVLPICTTINMNGCAAFILVSSLFVMQNGGITLGIGTMLLWVLISVIAAVGNAGVPMGCFFLTVSLMTGIGAPVQVMGLILPIYTIIDMVETAENVWSDSCVCAMTDKDLRNPGD